MKRPNELILDEEIEPEFASGGGAGTDDVFVDSDEGGEDYEAEGEEIQPEAPAAPDQNAVMLEMLRQNQQMLQQSQQTQQAPQQPQYTQEQVDQALKVYRMNPDTFGKIFDSDQEMEDRIDAMQSMIDGVSQHAAQMAILSANRAQQQISQQFAPAMQLVEKQTYNEFVGAIESDYPVLKNQQQLIDVAIKSLKSEGFHEPDATKARGAVANRVEQLVRVTNPSYSVRGGQQNKNQHQSANSGMPSMGSGGGGGAGGAANRSGGGGTKKSWAGVFD